jgi:hypothetical protein
MNDPLNTSGSWPTVDPGDVARVDFINRRRLPDAPMFDLDARSPGEVSGIPFQVFCVAIFLAGVTIAAIGVGVANGSFDWSSAVLYALGVAFGFAFRVMTENW